MKKAALFLGTGMLLAQSYLAEAADRRDLGIPYPQGMIHIGSHTYNDTIHQKIFAQRIKDGKGVIYEGYMDMGEMETFIKKHKSVIFDRILIETYPIKDDKRSLKPKYLWYDRNGDLKRGPGEVFRSPNMDEDWEAVKDSAPKPLTEMIEKIIKRP